MAWVCVIVVILTIARSLVFVLFEQAQFDADQAVMGLMAKHIGELRAFPFYVYAENYLFVVEAWLTAPFVAVFGLSVAVVRLPLVLLNTVAGVMLVALLARELHLRPVVALVPALFFVAAAPVLSAELLTAVGGNIEPFVYVLLLWLVRSRPVAFGAILVVGFMNREFTVYAVSALLVVEALQGRLWQLANLRQKAIVAAVFAAGWQLARLLRLHADVLGPGTAGMQDRLASNVSVAVGFICRDVDPLRIYTNLVSVATTHMGILLGVNPFRLRNVNIATPTSQGVWGLWPVFCAVMLAIVLRIGWLVWIRGRGPAPPSPPTSARPWFALYLALIGVQSAIVWALSRCGPIHPMTIRYALLAVFIPVAIVSYHLATERRAILRSAVMLFVLGRTVVSLQAHAKLLGYYVSRSGPSEYRLMADELVTRGIRYVQTDYWAAYMIDFLSDERVTATATDYMRILEYDLEVTHHLDRAVVLSRQPCPGGEPLRYWYLCKVEETR